MQALEKLTVTTAPLETVPTTPPPVRVEAAISLRSALDTMLSRAVDRATVVDLDGTVLGVITLDAIARIASGEPDSEPVRPWAAPRRRP